MPQRKPLVVGSDGLRQVLQTGDYIISTEYPQLINGNGSSAVIGTPVYASAADTFNLAKADAGGTADVIGLVAETTVASAATGGIITDGVLAFATTTQVDAIAGTTGGFTVGTHFFLSAAVAGKITSTPPTVAGQYNVYIGIAISTVELRLNIDTKMKL